MSMNSTAWGVHPPGIPPSSHPGSVCWRLGSQDTLCWLPCRQGDFTPCIACLH